MKRMIIIIAISLIIIGLLISFWIKSKNDLVNRQTLIPRFSTPELPSAIVNKPYEADLFASIVGAKAKMQITSLDIPLGLSISDCNQKYNISDLPKPNTIINCKLSGTLSEIGQIELTFKVGAEGYMNSSINKYSVYISN